LNISKNSIDSEAYKIKTYPLTVSFDCLIDHFLTSYPPSDAIKRATMADIFFDTPLFILKPSHCGAL